MRRFFYLIVGIFSIVFCSCRGLVREQQIVGNFYLIAVDSESEMNISFKVNEGGYVGVVPATVYSFGFDSEYIFAKQHPEGISGKTNFYIVPLKIPNPYRVDEEAIGPMNEIDFYKKLDELGVTRHDNLFQTTIDHL